MNAAINELTNKIEEVEREKALLGQEKIRAKLTKGTDC